MKSAMPLRHAGWRTIFIMVSIIIAGPLVANAQPIDLKAEELALVQVDWFEELLEGGVTMLALGVLSVVMVALAVERGIRLRRRRFAPQHLKQNILPYLRAGRLDDLKALAQKHPSPLADMVTFLIGHRSHNPDLVIAGVGDIVANTADDQLERTYPLAVIASLAPLLGLLGTMIGMIEAFKLVEVFGDEGGASLLAGSISKALITTAVGLILAIPALVVYHYFKHRVHLVSKDLTTTGEAMIQDWFLPSLKREKH